MLKQNFDVTQNQPYYTDQPYPYYTDQSYQFYQAYPQQIIVNSYFYLNNKDVKIKLTNGSFVKGKIVNQNIFTSNLLEVLISTSKKQITRFIPHDKILSIDLI